MIDIHCHILPGVDDGAEQIDNTLEMARAAIKQGISVIIATPHHKNNTYENEKSVILKKGTEVNKILDSEGLSITILPGQEIRIYGEVLDDYQKSEILPIVGSNYLLIELPSSHVPRYTEKMIYDLQVEGFIPIIAHPERNRELIQNQELVYELVKKGALTQLTAASVCGAFGKKIKRFSQQIIESNLAHFIASDAHNVTNRRFMLAEAYVEIEERYGADTVNFFKENAELLIRGKTVKKEIPQPITKNKFSGIFSLGG